MTGDGIDHPVHRRTVLGAIGVGMLPFDAPVNSLQTTAQGGGSAQYQGNRANSGYYPDECPPTGEVSWEWNNEEVGYFRCLCGRPGEIFGVNVNEEVVQVDPASGETGWRWDPESAATPAEFVNAPPTPVLEGETVYVGGLIATSGDGSGIVAALDATDGSLRWQRSIGSGATALTRAEDTLYVTHENGLEALDVSDGSTRWSRSEGTASPPDLRMWNLCEVTYAAVANGQVLRTTDENRLQALSPDDGSRTWESSFGATTTPSVADGTAYVGFHDGLVAYDIEDGRMQWARLLPDVLEHAPVVANGQVFTSVGADDGVTHIAFNAASGDENWRSETGHGEGFSVGLHPRAIGDTVIGFAVNPNAPTGEKLMQVLDAGSGEHLNTVPGEMTEVLFVDDRLILSRFIDGLNGLSIEGCGDGENGSERHTLMVGGNGPVDYTLTVDGTLEPATDAGNFTGESGDNPSENDDGTLTASDTTGPTGSTGGLRYVGDRYRFSGEIQSIDVSPQDSAFDANVYLDERQVSLDTLPGRDPDGETHSLTVTANGPTDYEITVDGALEPDTEGGNYAGEPNDEPSEQDDGSLSIENATGPLSTADGLRYLGDRFVFEGEVTEFTVEARDGSTEVRIYLDEEDVSRSAVLDSNS